MSGKITIRNFTELETLKKYSFLGHLQPLIDKNSEDLAILILEFDDVTVKTIYCSEVVGV